LAGVKARLSGQMDEWMAQQGDKGIATELIAHTRQGRDGKEENDPKVKAKAGESGGKMRKKKTKAEQ
jgi:hypothetical protein